MSLNEFIVEDAALEGFGKVGYAGGHGPHLAPSELPAKRDSLGEVVLMGRLCGASWRLNLTTPVEKFTCAAPSGRRSAEPDFAPAQSERRLSP